MNSGQYFLPGELVAYLAFVLLPASIVALSLQAFYFHKKSLFRSYPGKTAAALVGTVLLGSVVGIAISILAPAGFGRFLGVREVVAFGQAWPVWPFGFVALCAAGFVTSSWVYGGSKSAA